MTLAADDAYQTHILQGVSRTFALTIPVLPPALYRAVANGYLLCRIADTIEDDAELSLAAKRDFSEKFLAGVAGENDGSAFARALAPKLAHHNSTAERDLIAHTPTVLRITHSLGQVQQGALARCVRVMVDGMVHYQGQETLDGLPDQPAMDRYCYYVAGVVGEMLTELFCDFCPELRHKREHLMSLAVSFGQGLQMTNILKDIWDDRARGACWLPRTEFEPRGIVLSEVKPGQGGAGFCAGLHALVGIAHGHLRNALAYTLEIPGGQPGMRKFCLWALGMAVLTLRKINQSPAFAEGREVKISRRAVKATVLATSLCAQRDAPLRALFALAASGLPLHPVVPRHPTFIEGMEARHAL